MKTTLIKVLYAAAIAVFVFVLVNYAIHQVRLSGSSLTPTVVLTAKVQKNDTFRLFYQSGNQKKFTVQYSTPFKISGDNDFQQLVFPIPDRSVHAIRIDLGENKNQDVIAIEKVELFYNGVYHPIPIDSIDSFFWFNKFLEGDIQKGGLTPVAINGDYDPFMVAKQPLYQKLKEILNQPVQVKYGGWVASIIAISVFFFLFIRIKDLTYSPASVKGRIVTTMFLMVIVAPFLDEQFKLDSVSQNLENRRLNDRKAMLESSIEELPVAFADYYNDNFGFRNWLINKGSTLKATLFHTAGSEQVVFGDDGWVFLARAFGLYEDYTRRNLYPKAQLRGKSQGLERRLKLLNGQGIDYYKTFYPNKHTIYGEFIPERFQMQVIDTVKRVDQFIQYLGKHNSPIQIIDPTADLLEAKKGHQVYLKVDTHWNTYGAFVAYRTLFGEISKDHPDLKPSDFSDYEITWKHEGGGGHYNLLGIQNHEYITEDVPYFEPKVIVPIKELPVRGYPAKTVIHENPNLPDGKTALIFRDSFTIAMIPFISQHFKRVVYIWGTYSQDMVDKENPDIVIEAYVERYFK